MWISAGKKTSHPSIVGIELWMQSMPYASAPLWCILLYSLFSLEISVVKPTIGGAIAPHMKCYATHKVNWWRVQLGYS